MRVCSNSSRTGLHTGRTKLSPDLHALAVAGLLLLGAGWDS